MPLALQNKKVIVLALLAIMAASYLRIPGALSAAPPTSFSDLVKKVKPAVVNIATTTEIKRPAYDPWGSVDPFFRDFFGPFLQQQPSPKQHHSLGTGFIINRRGDIITNNHVVEGADEIIVKLGDGRTLKAKMIGRDVRLDIAILRPIEEGDYPFTTLGDSDELEVGDWVVAIGNPFGLGHTVTAGIVSAKERVLGAGPYDDFIQTDASINPGNSGGPLFNINGEVVGINTAIVASGQGIGFAIPINMAKDVTPQLISKGRVDRGWLGVAVRDVTEEEARKNGLAKPQGAFIAEVVPGSPADRAGVKVGDIVLKLNNLPIENSHDLPTSVAKIPPGGEATMVFLHQGKSYEKKALLGSLDQPGASVASSGSIEKTGFFGMSLRDLSSVEKQRVRGGVVVMEVQSGSLAESVGILAGDLLIEVNGEVIAQLNQLKQMIQSVQSGEVIRLGLVRGPHRYYFAFRKE